MFLVLQGVQGFSNKCVGLHSSFEPVLLCMQGIKPNVGGFVMFGVVQHQSLGCSLCSWIREGTGSCMPSYLSQSTSDERAFCLQNGKVILSPCQIRHGQQPVLNQTCRVFVIQYELLFGETGVREPAVFTLAHCWGQEPEMFLAKRAECSFSLFFTLSSCHPFHMQQSQKQITGGSYSLPIQ